MSRHAGAGSGFCLARAYRVGAHDGGASPPTPRRAPFQTTAASPEPTRLTARHRGRQGSAMAYRLQSPTGCKMAESTSRPQRKPAARRNRERPAGQAASKPAARKDPSAHRAGQAAAQWVRADSLKPWKRNPRRNDEAAVKVAASIRRFGFGAPMVARAETRELIAGHTRLKAVALLMDAWADADGDTRAAWVSGPEEQRWCHDAIQLAESGLVPVRFLDVTEEQAHLLALADNRLGEAADWDSTALNDLLQELDRGDADLAGWTPDDVDALLGPSNVDELAIEQAFGAIPGQDRQPFQQVAFVLHDSQVQVVKQALALSKDRNDFSESPNDNSNGNSIAAICRDYLDG